MQFLNTLGVTQCSAGDWSSWIATLHRALGLCEGGNAFDWFFLAMASWRLGEVEAANE